MCAFPAFPSPALMDNRIDAEFSTARQDADSQAGNDAGRAIGRTLPPP